MRERLQRVLRLPALHFLILGGLLFAGSTRSAGSAAMRQPIVITAARVAEIRDDYRQTLRAEPSAAELAALVDREAEEEMLYQEALLLGLDRGDRAVEWRVVEKMQFLFGGAAGSNAEAYRRGIALGLARDDVLVRQALATKMRLLAKAASRNEEPAGADLDRALEQYFRAHPEAYAQPERLSLTHVFLSASRRGAALESDARALRPRLEATPISPEAASKWGDAFLAGSTLRNATPADVARTFGDACAAAILRLEAGRWSESLRSPYGLHLVWVFERRAAAVPEFEAVRSRVLRAYRADRHAEYVARMVEQLRQAYPVQVEDEDHAQS